ncbi:hypothetical protein F5141DRAFT_1065774 [Pisolithus sp. B1]|nr:hypothetical protein F5141DRAFT_1065774 [Pisolithus sp. B1]
MPFPTLPPLPVAALALLPSVVLSLKTCVPHTNPHTCAPSLHPTPTTCGSPCTAVLSALSLKCIIAKDLASKVNLYVPPVIMARTKQTARKATGGSAPRVNLQVLQKKKAKAKAASNKPSLKIPANVNSGWWGHVVSEEYMYKVKKADVKFICNDPKPYFGFYSKGEPVLSTPPIIPGGFQHAMTSQVAPLPTALVHLHLEGLHQDIGHPQLPFNLATPESMEAYEKEASHLANTLCAYSRVVLFLTTHSDEDRGDLFTGYLHKKPVASKPFQVLQLLLSPLSKVADGADIVFYVCGSVVTNPQSFDGVKEVAQQFTPRSMLLFDAQNLQLAFTVPYLQSLLDNTIIQGFPISSAAKVALNNCGMLGRHSNIILVMCQKEGLVVEKFLWTDKYIKPWGHHLPVQCPQCGTIQKWVGGSAEKTMTYECQYSECGKDMGAGGMSLPPKIYTFSIPENATQLPQGKRGTSSWLQITLYVKFGPTPTISDAHRGWGMCLESNDGQRAADSHDRSLGEGIGFNSCAAPLYEPSPWISEIEKSHGRAIEAVQYRNNRTNIWGTVKFQGTEMSENFSRGMSTEDRGEGWDKEKVSKRNSAEQSVFRAPTDNQSDNRPKA